MTFVEEPQRNAEGEEREQVEVPQRERSAEIGETDQKGDGETEPDREAVDLLPAERARASARHLPRDLRAGPGLRDRACCVLDAARRDLAHFVDAGPDLDRPVAERRVVARV